MKLRKPDSDTRLAADWWWYLSGSLPRWLRRWLPCLYCNNDPTGCDCGADDIGWEITGGNHYAGCITYNGCPQCGREQR